MSASYELQFEDAVWNEFCHDGDHIVPEPGRGQSDNHSILSDSQNYKKRLHEIISVTGNKSSFTETSSLTSDNARSSSHGFKSNTTDSNGSGFCKDDTMLNDKTTALNNSFNYSLGEATYAENNQNFFENTDDKDLSDLLYNDWPEMGNFEDVDEMFRNCDSTFGFGISGEDESRRLSPAYNIGGNFSGVEGVDLVFPSESSSLNVQETSTVGSDAGDISPGASSFRQLQLVMEQVRFIPVINNTSLMDVETDSNPVDRSMAHLLFYTPSEFSVIHA